MNPAVLRAWEKRYGVVVPSRTEGGQRLYSDDDVLRLSLLHRAVEEGRAISQVAPLSTEELKGLVKEDEAERASFTGPEPIDGPSPARILERAQRAVDKMEPGELEKILTRGAMAFSVSTIIEEIVVPLLGLIGRGWESGRLRPAQEHLASVEIRRFLEWMLGTVNRSEGAPVLVSGTPAGERHELGAIISAITGAAEGWDSVYLGPDLPAEEIVLAALRLEAEVVALSCVDPSIVDTFPEEIGKVRERLPADVQLVVGGPAVNGRPEVQALEGVEVLADFQELRTRLRESGP
ncbi:MAG: MerR family transcriptional regulator [Gemmatimonadetes bacterium]|nr:MerR family transcriptional regulator [Gemmatimonadota bacterium]NNM05765.1 MerR family transcriptional regulator [Gemmatimonadota bacterium]